MATDDVCPVCYEVGRSGTLVLRQLNANEAVYVCDNSLCPFPVGLSDQIVENPVPELQPNTDLQEENDIPHLEGEETAECANTLEKTIIDEYEVNVLLDPELDMLMEEL